MQYEVRTRMKPGGVKGPEIIMEILLTPRGSGNRKYAQALARAAESHPEFGCHVRRVRVGASKVMVVFEPSAAFGQAMLSATFMPKKSTGIPGQLGLLGVPMSA